LATGDLGRSFATGESVFSRLAAQAPATLELAAFSLLVTVVLGVILGMVSAVHRNDWIDTTIQSVMLALASMPSFWLGILFMLIFSVWLRWLPAIGNGSVAQLMLPVATMGLASAGRLAPMVRNNLVEVLGGLVVIETLFARQGLGRIIAEAIGNKDIPMVQGAVLFFAVVYVTINLFVDLSYRWIDPRIAL
jgi:peptide/nickel transport system permease protein